MTQLAILYSVIFLGILMAILAIRLITIDANDKSKIFEALVIAITLVIFTSAFTNSIGYDSGQRDALKGIQTYQTKIRYELKDSVYVPIDTLFNLKIE